MPTGGKRNRLEMEQPEGASPTLEQRSVRPRFDDPSQRDPLADDHRSPANHVWESPRCGQSCNNSPASQPSLVPLQWSTCSSPKSLSDIMPLRQATSSSKIDKETVPILTEVNPESGSIAGGATVWLKGMDFPTAFPLFARFGTTVVPTVRPCFCLLKFISPRLLDIFCFQPSCLSFALSKHARCC